MFEYLHGTLTAIAAETVVIDVAGVGYRVIVANPYRLSKQLQQTVTLRVHLSLAQDQLRLYGFVSAEEKALFLQLISVSGIGPRSALSILAFDDPAGLVRAIDSEDVTFLMRFPGVGKKTAQQIILDLRGKLDLAPDAVQETADADAVPYAKELRGALEGLGYSAKQIERVLTQTDFSAADSVESAIRIALHALVKR